MLARPHRLRPRLKASGKALPTRVEPCVLSSSMTAHIGPCTPLLVLPNTIGGLVQGSGMSSSGSFSSSAGRDFSLEAGSVTDASVSASYSSKNFFNGSVVNRTSANTVTFTSSYQPSYDQVATLAGVAGSYASTVATTGGDDPASFTISPAGLLSGVSATGCQFQGSLAVRGATNVYNLSVTFMGAFAPMGRLRPPAWPIWMDRRCTRRR